MSAELERAARSTRSADRWRARAGRARGFEACCTPDVSYEDPVAVDPLRGVDALDAPRAGAAPARSPTCRIEATAPPLVARRRTSCVPWRALGTHRGDLGQMLPATDRFVTLHGLHYLELTDGAVRRARGFFDLYDAATQLGLLPARGGLGETALLLLRGFGLQPRPAYLTVIVPAMPGACTWQTYSYVPGLVELQLERVALRSCRRRPDSKSGPGPLSCSRRAGPTRRSSR